MSAWDTFITSLQYFYKKEMRVHKTWPSNACLAGNKNVYVVMKCTYIWWFIKTQTLLSKLNCVLMTMFKIDNDDYATWMKIFQKKEATYKPLMDRSS